MEKDESLVAMKRVWVKKMDSLDVIAISNLCSLISTTGAVPEVMWRLSASSDSKEREQPRKIGSREFIEFTVVGQFTSYI